MNHKPEMMARRDKVLALIDQGLNITQIAERMNISRQMVYHCRDMKLTTLEKLKRLDKRNEAMAEEYRNGKSFQEIGEIFDLKAKTVHRVLLETMPDYEPRLKGYELKGRNMRMKASYKSGKTFEELSIEFGLCIPTIKNIVLERKTNKPVKKKVDPDDIWADLSREGHVPARVL